MNTRSLFKTVLLGLLLPGFVGCGGGDSDNKSDQPASAPEAPKLTLGYAQIKIFHFSWSDVEGETEYRLLENPDGASGFSEVATLAADSESHELVVFLPERINARYILQACNDIGCSDSTEVSVTGNLDWPIGYLMGENIETEDNFAMSVALDGDGDTLAVGAVGEDSSATIINGNGANNGAPGSGAVYVFSRDGASWVQQAYIKADNAAAGDTFGTSVALSEDGNVLAVGAPREDGPDDGSVDDSGAVYLFTRSGSDWSQSDYLRASNAGAGDLFGSSLSLSGDGDTLLVGAPYEDSEVGQPLNDTQLDSGAAYLFIRSGAGWSQQDLLKAASVTKQAYFGGAVALSGNGRFAAVGARNYSSYSGNVRLFIRDTDSWNPGPTLQGSDTQIGDSFGAALAFSPGGSLLAIGATGKDTDLDDNVGAVYIYRAMTADWSIWNEEATLTAAYATGNSGFGNAVDFSDDATRLAVGARYEDSGSTGINDDPSDTGATDSGAAYLFSSDGGDWSQVAYIKAANTDAQDRFGYSLALSGDGETLAVGAITEDGKDDVSPNSGALYLY